MSFLEGPIRTSRSWGASDFKANSKEGQQAAEFIWGRLLGRYGAPLAPVDTTSARVDPTTEAAAHAALNGVDAQVLWGNDPCAHLDNSGVDTGAREPLVLTPFGKAVVRAFAAGSGLG